MTVNRARATVPDVTVDERLGLDGKTRRLPVRETDDELIQADIGSPTFSNHIILNAVAALKFSPH